MALAALLATAVAPGCLQRLAIGGLSSALSGAGDVFASDEDPQLVREAMPFALKSMEALVAAAPEDQGLLLATCRSFTQYTYAFVETDATLLEWEDFSASERLRERAQRLYLRARDYGLRALDLRHPGLAAALPMNPEAALAETDAEDLPYLYWTGASWGAAISSGLDRPELLADVDVARACLRRVLALDPGYGNGAIDQAMLSIELLPEAMGGSRERALAHFEQALERSGGASAGLFVTLAAGSAVARQDRTEFERLLERALAIDPNAEPSLRLANHVAQTRARHLLDNVDELFFDSLD